MDGAAKPISGGNSNFFDFKSSTPVVVLKTNSLVYSKVLLKLIVPFDFFGLLDLLLLKLKPATCISTSYTASV